MGCPTLHFHLSQPKVLSNPMQLTNSTAPIGLLVVDVHMLIAHLSGSHTRGDTPKHVIEGTLQLFASWSAHKDASTSCCCHDSKKIRVNDTEKAKAT